MFSNRKKEQKSGLIYLLPGINLNFCYVGIAVTIINIIIVNVKIRSCNTSQWGSCLFYFIAMQFSKENLLLDVQKLF